MARVIHRAQFPARALGKQSGIKMQLASATVQIALSVERIENTGDDHISHTVTMTALKQLKKYLICE